MSSFPLTFCFFRFDFREQGLMQPRLVSNSISWPESPDVPASSSLVQVYPCALPCLFYLEVEVAPSFSVLGSTCPTMSHPQPHFAVSLGPSQGHLGSCSLGMCFVFSLRLTEGLPFSYNDPSVWIQAGSKPTVTSACLHYTGKDLFPKGPFGRSWGVGKWET